jgi:Leucine-rich repeat (LRR) protein
LPPEIGNLTTLKTLYLSGNQFTELPPVIGNLSGLENLFLNDNQLSSLPPEIAGLSSLCFLDLRGNPITAAPAGLENLPITTDSRCSQRREADPITGPATGLWMDGAVSSATEAAANQMSFEYLIYGIFFVLFALGIVIAIIKRPKKEKEKAGD